MEGQPMKRRRCTHTLTPRTAYGNRAVHQYVPITFLQLYRSWQALQGGPCTVGSTRTPHMRTRAPIHRPIPSKPPSRCVIFFNNTALPSGTYPSPPELRFLPSLPTLASSLPTLASSLPTLAPSLPTLAPSLPTLASSLLPTTKTTHCAITWHEGKTPLNNSLRDGLVCFL